MMNTTYETYMNALKLRNYMKLAHPGVSISKPGYLKQRMKLNPAYLSHLTFACTPRER